LSGEIAALTIPDFFDVKGQAHVANVEPDATPTLPPFI